MPDAHERGQAATPIIVTGAHTNNLRDVNLTLPKRLLAVFTGVSGSGKSSLVLDTIAAESQRLVNDSYSTFIRARLPQMPAPEVQAMDGLTFAVLIDQRRFTGNSRSTVATATDLAPLLRLVFSRIATPSAGYSPAYSFNDPAGMCPTCEGLGTVYDIDIDELFDPRKSIDEGPVRFSMFRPGVYRWKRFAYSGLFDRSKPLKDYTPEEMDLFLHADRLKLEHPDPRFPKSARFDGVITRMRDVYFKQGRSKMSAAVRAELEQVVTTHVPRLQGGQGERRGQGEPDRWQLDRGLDADAGHRVASPSRGLLRSPCRAGPQRHPPHARCSAVRGSRISHPRPGVRHAFRRRGAAGEDRLPPGQRPYRRHLCVR